MPFADPEAKRAYRKAHYEANKEKNAARKKAYYEANKERMKAQSKAWAEANKERRAARKKAWEEANPERRKASIKKATTKRRRLVAEGPIDDGITAKSVAERDDHICAECGITVVEHPGGFLAEGWTIGHIVALAKGGTHTWDNVQCECHACNTAKGIK